jgi:hypothetical protein
VTYKASDERKGKVYVYDLTDRMVHLPRFGVHWIPLALKNGKPSTALSDKLSPAMSQTSSSKMSFEPNGYR